MKCAIIGDSIISRKVTSDQMFELDKFASFCENNNIMILTGGCSGYPFIIGEKCIKKNVKVVGYSPAKNEREHVEVFRHPQDGCSSFIYLFDNEKSINYRFLARSLPLINNSDIVIALGGNWGTLFEIITGVICGKKIIIWQGFGGICDMFNSIYDKMSKECHYDYGECISYVKSVDEIELVINEVIKD